MPAEPASTAPVVAIGADGAPAGWLAACLRADALDRQRATIWETELVLAPTIEDLVNLRGDGGGPVCIDVPIGLFSTVEYRPCDVEARERLKSPEKPRDRRNSVFAAPARYMLAAAGDYTRIRELVAEEQQRNPQAKGFSSQAAGIVPKVRDVDAWVRANPGSVDWLWECHPELCFARLADGTPCLAKASAGGAVERLRLLREAFDDVEEGIAGSRWPAKAVGLSDILDAYAALATAIRCARGKHEVLGGGERDGEGVAMRMAL